MGGISNHTTFNEFKEYFEIFGELTDVFLPNKTDDSTLNNGFGFVTFKLPENALSVLNHQKIHSIRAKWVT